MIPLIVKKKEVDGSDLYFVTSETEGGHHLLFMEWDNEIPKTTLRIMKALQIPGILIKTPRGHHFISSLPPMEFRITSILQRLFKADPAWIKHNHERGFSCLRVSAKYEGEKSLWVLGYFFEDKELAREYERLVKTYFNKGEPYSIPGDYAF